MIFPPFPTLPLTESQPMSRQPRAAPVCPGNGAEQTWVPAKTDGGVQHRKHVFVLDDAPALLDLFRDLLGDEGYSVTLQRFTLEMGEMLDTVKAARPDLLILDYLIGDKAPGWHFLQRLKMDRETRDIPVVVCTAAVKQAEAVRPHLEEMGVACVLKPFDIDHLLGVIGMTWAKPESAASATCLTAATGQLGRPLTVAGMPSAIEMRGMGSVRGSATDDAVGEGSL